MSADASENTADRLLEAIIDRFGLLAEQPRIGRLRPELGPNVRSFSVENYVIYYRTDPEVVISRVLHGRRDHLAAWQEWLNGPRSPSSS